MVSLYIRRMGTKFDVFVSVYKSVFEALANMECDLNNHLRSHNSDVGKYLYEIVSSDSKGKVEQRRTVHKSGMFTVSKEKK